MVTNKNNAAGLVGTQTVNVHRATFKDMQCNPVGPHSLCHTLH